MTPVPVGWASVCSTMAPLGAEATAPREVRSSCVADGTSRSPRLSKLMYVRMGSSGSGDGRGSSKILRNRRSGRFECESKRLNGAALNR